MTHVSLVPTPIGNLQDITLRALEVLKDADVIAAEDTRHTGKLLEHFQIKTPLVRLDAHTMQARAPSVLAQYEKVAFVSDAGTPGVSDPGYELVKLALARGDTVDVLPGATAFVPALVVSGLPVARFAFEGFLPRKGAARKSRLQTIATRPITTAIYESPKRLLATLKELASHCGESRPATVSREISKRFETTYRGTLAMLINTFSEEEPRGECVIVVGVETDEEKAETQAQELARKAKAQAATLAAQGSSAKDIRKVLQALGIARNDAYEIALAAIEEQEI